MKKKFKQINLSSFTSFEDFQRDFSHMIQHDAKHLYIWRKGRIINSTGDCLTDTENCQDCYDIATAKDCRNCFGGYELKDAIDCTYVYKELGYENCECFPMPFKSVFNVNSYNGNDLYYCDLCMSCSNCFACVGLKRQKYCILNKQFSKIEYEELVPQLIKHMQLTKEWGRFFPIKMSPFAYNESEAQDLFPLSKEEVQQKEWQWKEPIDDISEIVKTIPSMQLPDTINEIPDDILNWAITCSKSERPFKIIKRELDFYRNMGLPVPRIHPNIRLLRRKQMRNPRIVTKNKCAKCDKDIQTTYAPNRPETVYCEECYLETVY